MTTEVCPYCNSTKLVRQQYVHGGQLFLMPLQCKECESIEIGTNVEGCSQNEKESGWIIGNKLFERRLQT